MAVIPPVYALMSGAAAVTAIVGDRIGAFGEVDQGSTRPYLTWQIVLGQPYDQISGSPCADLTTVQHDCWSPNEQQAIALARAVVGALDGAGWANRVRLMLFEPQTKMYRVTIDGDYITGR